MSRLELKIPPAAWFAFFALAMWGLAAVCPFAAVSIPWKRAGALALALPGGLCGVAGILAFLKVRTTVHPHRPERASALVTTGIYRASRNPMYLGLLLILAGWAMVLANAAAMLALPAFVACMNRFQIRPEERILRAKFGAEFDAYARAVRRWL